MTTADRHDGDCRDLACGVGGTATLVAAGLNSGHSPPRCAGMEAGPLGEIGYVAATR